MTWIPERIDQLKKLWAAGESASVIAATLGGTTRNAVIGKVHRLGLAGRRTRVAVSHHHAGILRVRTIPGPGPVQLHAGREPRKR